MSIPFQVVSVEEMHKFGRKLTPEYAELYSAFTKLDRKDCLKIRVADKQKGINMSANLTNLFSKKRADKNGFYARCKVVQIQGSWFAFAEKVYQSESTDE